jgi:hypothetical protein
VRSISPASGSIGGGQVVTVAGSNFKSGLKFNLSLQVTVNGAGGSTSVTSPCKVLTSEYSRLTCVTSPLPQAFQLLKAPGSTHAAVVRAETLLSGDGDLLRVVSQGERYNYPDSQKPGIFVLSAQSGVEHRVPFYFAPFIGLMAMLYDPYTRTVAASCGLGDTTATSNACVASHSDLLGLRAPVDLVAFVQSATPRHLLVVETHFRYLHVNSAAAYPLVAALKKCGGGPSLEKFLTPGTDYRQYLFVGQCGAGLPVDYSNKLGLDAKQLANFKSLELQFDPFEHFNFSVSTSGKSPLVVANPNELLRSYSSVMEGDLPGAGYARSRLDSAQAWSAKVQAPGEWAQLDLGAVFERVTKYHVSVSDDGVAFQDVDDGAFFDGPLFNEDDHVAGLFSSPVSARFVRVVVDAWETAISLRFGVEVNDPAAAASVAAVDIPFTFDEALTPTVQWISRRNGTTAGGTTVTVFGKGFVPGSTAVTLAGVACALTYAEIGSYRGKHLCLWAGVDCAGLGVDPSGTSLTCLTNPWTYQGAPFRQEVSVTVGGKGSSVSAPHVDWSYMNLWSSNTTWGGGPPPERATAWSSPTASTSSSTSARPSSTC